MEHVNEVCQQANLSYGVKHMGFSRLLGTQPIKTARRVPFAYRTWFFVDPVLITRRPSNKGERLLHRGNPGHTLVVDDAVALALNDTRLIGCARLLRPA